MNLFIPNKINVGFQEREDTYTKKLAYIIYWDSKGKLRKETSWNSWRDDKIPNQEFLNIPTEGFVLNKGVGGTKQSWGWNTRSEYIRVYDPRDFEFEISVSNLLFILRECDCSKGKGLEGKFVYAWDGTELVLLPEQSQDYQSSQNFTKLQGLSVKSKDLIKGATYQTKDLRDLVYLGKLDYHYIVVYDGYAKWQRSGGCIKRHVFWDGKRFEFMDSLKSLGTLKSDTIHPEYAELIDKYLKGPNGSKVKAIYLKENTKKQNYRNYFVYEKDGSYFVCSNESGYYKDIISQSHKISLRDGVVFTESAYDTFYKNGREKIVSVYGYRSEKVIEKTFWVEPTNKCLGVLLESGSEFSMCDTYGIYLGESDE